MSPCIVKCRMYASGNTAPCITALAIVFGGEGTAAPTAPYLFLLVVDKAIAPLLSAQTVSRGRVDGVCGGRACPIIFRVECPSGKPRKRESQIDNAYIHNTDD